MPVCQRVELAAGSHVPFHLKKGVTSVSWDFSCTNCTDGVSLGYGILATEQFKQLEAANLLDADRDNNKPISIECLSMFADIHVNSSRVLPLKASIDYTILVYNQFNDLARVSGEAAAFTCVRRRGPTHDALSLMYAACSVCLQVASPRPPHNNESERGGK